MVKKTAPKKSKQSAPTMNFRFKSPEHHSQVVAAANARGLSINGWIVQATIIQAEAQASEAK